MFNTSIKTEEIVELVTENIKLYSLVLYNDDFNTFDHVIDCLVKYCNHNTIQAEQCAWIVHNNGKCVVKEGDFSLLEPICSALQNQSLSAQIEINI